MLGFLQMVDGKHEDLRNIPKQCLLNFCPKGQDPFLCAVSRALLVALLLWTGFTELNLLPQSSMQLGCVCPQHNRRSFPK